MSTGVELRIDSIFGGLEIQLGGIVVEQFNRTPAMMPLVALYFGVYYSEGHISLKNWTYCPLLRESATPFKSTCFLIKLK
jgi:hypothetical protein